MPEDDEYHTVTEQIEGFAWFAFRRNLLTETLCSILYAGCSWNSGGDDTMAAGLFKGFFDSSPIMDGCKGW
jgi:hypothetical protein